MADTIIPLVMCGGAGTRLWPASRESRPKQFLPIFGPRSTFQETVLRVSEASIFQKPIIVTGHDYRFLVAEQLAEIGIVADVVLEPMRRESAPAIVAGTRFATRRGDDPIILVLASDHVVTERELFEAACQTAQQVAATG